MTVDALEVDQPTTTISGAWAPERRIIGIQKFLIDVKYLWIEQMMEVRTTWYFFMVFSLFMPLSMVFGFARMGSGLTDRTSLLYIISGAAIFSVASEGLISMAQRIGSMRKEGMLIYYASLPISKVAFIIAVMLSRLVVTLPGMLLPMIAGPLIYGIKLEFSPWVLVLLPLTALTLSAIGMAFGSFISSLELIQVIMNVFMFILLMSAPVFIPPEALPLPLRILGYCLPPSYAADALRHALAGTIGTAFYWDMFMLILMTLLSFFALARWLRWQLQ